MFKPFFFHYNKCPGKLPNSTPRGFTAHFRPSPSKMIKHYIGIQEEWKISQVELDQLIKNCSFKSGDIICLKTATVTAPGQCHIVLDLEKDVDKIDYNYNKEPRFLRILSCYLTDNIPINSRLDVASDYKKLERDIFKKLIVPIYDKLQDCIEQAKQAA